MQRTNPSSRDRSPKFWGVVEGFYGRPWTCEQRSELCDWMGNSGLNSYLYSPKDDTKHRLYWYAPYTRAEARDLARLIEQCQRHGLRFIYGLAPGFRADFTQQVMERHLRRKIDQLVSLGCRSFALLFDDIPPEGSVENLKRYGSWAGAHITWTHSVRERLLATHPEVQLLFCPTPYCGAMSGAVRKNEYLLEVGECLSADVEVFWTGRDIVSERITVPEIRELANVIRRRPVLWDNLYANDYDLRRLYLGPYAGRDLALRSEVRGILINPNCEYRANFAPFRAFAGYVNARRSWDSRADHRRALEEWLPSFEDRAGASPTVDELEFLTDCLHLPYSCGAGAKGFVEDAASLLLATGTKRATLRRRFDRVGDLLVRWQSRITELEDRDFSYTLYRFVWELKEEVDLLQRFLKWQEQPGRSRSPFRSLFHQPGTYRGGLAAQLQRLLKADPDGSFKVAKRPSGLRS